MNRQTVPTTTRVPARAASRLDQAKAEAKARKLAPYVRGFRAAIEGKPQSVWPLAYARVPSLTNVGKDYVVTLHRPRWARDEVIPLVADWPEWECECSWASHHSTGKDGVRACAHVRAVRIWLRLRELDLGTRGVEWRDRLANDWVTCVSEPMLVPPEALEGEWLDAMNDLVARLSRGEIAPGDPAYVAARFASAIVARQSRAQAIPA